MSCDAQSSCKKILVGKTASLGLDALYDPEGSTVLESPSSWASPSTPDQMLSSQLILALRPCTHRASVCAQGGTGYPGNRAPTVHLIFGSSGRAPQGSLYSLGCKDSAFGGWSYYYFFFNRKMSQPPLTLPWAGLGNHFQMRNNFREEVQLKLQAPSRIRLLWSWNLPEVGRWGVCVREGSQDGLLRLDMV